MCQEGAEDNVQGGGSKTAQAYGCASVLYCPFGIGYQVLYSHVGTGLGTALRSIPVCKQCGTILVVT